MTYKQAIFKRKIEAIFAWPFVMLGKMMAPFFSLRTKHGLFIFSSSADIGGSIKVNADLCSIFADKSPAVIFSKKPKNSEFLHKFQVEGVRLIDLHKQVDNKLYHFINFFYRGVIAAWINKSENPIVIGGESLFFFKVLPYINKKFKTVEISHLNTWFNFSQAFIKDIDERVFSTAKLKRDAEDLYKKNNLPKEWYSRLHYVDNMIDLPGISIHNNPQLEVIFVGRGAPQKRVYLIANIAKKLHEMKSNVHFSFIGDVDKVFNIEDYPYCTFHGNVQDSNQMALIYQQSDVLLLTSAYEGLPLAIMEMMSHGKVVVSTAVDGIPDYITNGENGFLLQNFQDENKIVQEGIEILSALSVDHSLLEKVGRKSRVYVENNFSQEVFYNRYKQILFG